MTHEEKQKIKSILNVIEDKINDGIDNIQGGDLWQAETELNDALCWIDEGVGELNESVLEQTINAIKDDLA